MTFYLIKSEKAPQNLRLFLLNGEFVGKQDYNPQAHHKIPGVEKH